MELFKEVEAPVSELKTFGTVASQIGKTGTIELFPANLKRDNKLVAVRLTNSKKETQMVYCSVNLSAQIRKDKMEKQALINYLASLEIAETTNDAGEERFKIVLGQGSTVGGHVTAAPVATAASFADQIAW